MMKGNQSVLDVGSCSQLRRGAKQDTHLSRTHFCEQFSLFQFCSGFMDESNLFSWNAFFHQFLPHIIIHIKRTVIFRCGKIAEDKLCRTVLCCLLPDIKGIFHTAIYLAVREIREHIVDKPLIQSAFTSIVSDFQHVILMRFHTAAPYHFRPVCECTDQLFLLRAGL